MCDNNSDDNNKTVIQGMSINPTAHTDDIANDKQTIVTMARRLLHRRIRMRLVDGRILIGNFQCLDKQGNILLSNTVEIRKKNASSHGSGTKNSISTTETRGPVNAGWDERMVGLVVVPPHARKSCEVKATENEAVFLFDESI